MAWTFIASIVLIVIKFIVCKFSFWILIDTVAVILFCLRMIGATFKVKVLSALHGVSLGLWLLWTFMFGGWENWPRMLAYFIISAITCGIMTYEDLAYVIVEKDERSYKEEDEDGNS